MRFKNKELIAGIAAVLIAAVAFGIISFTSVLRHQSLSSYHLTARFNQTEGLNIGNEVRVAGIKVGDVIDQRLDDHYGVVVTLALPTNIQLPDDSSASVNSESLLGKKYIEIVPGGSEDMLQHNGVIEFTQDSPNLEKLLDKVIAISKANRKKEKCKDSK